MDGLTVSGVLDICADRSTQVLLFAPGGPYFFVFGDVCDDDAWPFWGLLVSSFTWHSYNCLSIHSFGGQEGGEADA